MYQLNTDISLLSLAAPLLLILMIFSLIGPAPKRLWRRTALSLMVFAVLELSGVTLAVFQGAPQTIAMVFIAVGIIAATLATWLARGKGREDDGGGGGGDWTDPEPNQPKDGLGFDWDDFDKRRSGWERHRQPASRS